MRAFLLSLLLPLSASAVCEIQTPQPPCWASGPVARLCAKPARPWPGEWEWLIGSQVVATTAEPLVELPCRGTDPLVVKVRTKGGPLFTMRPTYCANPWDTNQNGVLSNIDMDRQASIVSKKCSLGRKP